MNFEEEALAWMVNNLCRSGDSVFLVTVTRDSGLEPSCELRAYQTPEVTEFVFEPLRLLGGLRRDFEPALCWANGRLEFRFRVLNSVSLAGLPKLVADDEVITGFSRRPSWDENQAFLGKVFQKVEVVLCEGGTAVGIGVL